MARFEFYEWLKFFLDLSSGFEWDRGNAYKNEIKHGITIEQIESCFDDNKMILLGLQTQPKFEEERFGILARDLKGIVLFICFTFRNDKIRVVNARRANKLERLQYEKI